VSFFAKVDVFSVFANVVFVICQGDHSTKIEGVVHCLLEIQASEPHGKSLVFSTVGACVINSLSLLVVLSFLYFFGCTLQTGNL